MRAEMLYDVINIHAFNNVIFQTHAYQVTLVSSVPHLTASSQAKFTFLIEHYWDSLCYRYLLLVLYVDLNWSNYYVPEFEL